MKYFLTIIASFYLSAALAQRPEPIYGYAREQRSIAWYKEQTAAWKKVIDENPKDAMAWYYYYYGNRNLNFHDTTDTRSAERKKQDMEELIEAMGRQIPESYEYNLCKWMAGGFDTKLLPYLEKAKALGENRTEHLDFYVNLGEINRDIPERDACAKKKYDAGLISTGMLYYNYNVMMGLEKNAILITCGDNDTYPVWVLQAQGIRKDITVVNLYLIGIDEYREKLFAELGVEKYRMRKTANPDSSRFLHAQFRKGLITRLANNSKNYPVYVALTAATNEYAEAIQENLYLTGMAYYYSKEPIDNVALLRRNFEQQYALDYLENSFYKDISAPLVKEINRNYLVPMLKLFDHYKSSGEIQKMEWIKRKILTVCKGIQEEEEIREYLVKQ
jgi:hypothetical protein